MDELERLVENARSLVRQGYYDTVSEGTRSPSLLGALVTAEPPSDIIAEIKFSSPSRPTPVSGRFPDLLRTFTEAEPLGLSILAEPNIFGGRLEYVRQAAAQGLPVLFKDVVVDPRQVDAAASTGASAVLLIQTLSTCGLSVPAPQTLIDRAHERDLDVVLEVHSLDDLDAARVTDADVLGINNRDLSTREVDLATTPALLDARPKDRPVIAMSGIESRAQADAMRRAGADAVLVGSSVMTDPDPRRKLEELLHG